jgi:hypothetical protein
MEYQFSGVFNVRISEIDPNSLERRMGWNEVKLDLKRPDSEEWKTFTLIDKMQFSAEDVREAVLERSRLTALNGPVDE